MCSKIWVGLAETGFHVAHFVVLVGCDVGWGLLVVGPADVLVEVGMEDGGVGCDGLLYVVDAGQFFVLDVNEEEGLLGDFGGVGGDGGDFLADESDCVAGEDGEVADGAAYHLGRDVVAGEDGMDAGESAGLAGVDTEDAGVGERAAQAAADQHVGGVEVGDVLGLAGDFGRAFETADRLADYPVGWIGAGGHGGLLVGKVGPYCTRAPYPVA